MEIKLDPDDLQPLVREIVRETLEALDRVPPAKGRPAGPTQPETLLLTSREAAKALQVCERTLWTLTNSGEIPAVRIGQSLRYAPADLNRWIDTKRQEPPPKKKPKPILDKSTSGET